MGHHCRFRAVSLAARPPWIRGFLAVLRCRLSRGRSRGNPSTERLVRRPSHINHPDLLPPPPFRALNRKWPTQQAFDRRPRCHEHPYERSIHHAKEDYLGGVGFAARPVLDRPCRRRGGTDRQLQPRRQADPRHPLLRLPRAGRGTTQGETAARRPRLGDPEGHHAGRSGEQLAPRTHHQRRSRRGHAATEVQEGGADGRTNRRAETVGRAGGQVRRPLGLRSSRLGRRRRLSRTEIGRAIQSIDSSRPSTRNSAIDRRRKRIA